MAKRNQLLTATFYINGEQVESLTEEQQDKIVAAFGEALSRYYTYHPEEFARLCKGKE